MKREDVNLRLKTKSLEELAVKCDFVSCHNFNDAKSWPLDFRAGCCYLVVIFNLRSCLEILIISLILKLLLVYYAHAKTLVKESGYRQVYFNLLYQNPIKCRTFFKVKPFDLTDLHQSALRCEQSL